VPSFKDNEGREWEVSIDLFGVGEVHRETGVSIYTLMDDKMKGLAELCSNENKHILAHVVYLLCKEQAEKRNVSPRDFAKALKGDPIEAMELAFCEALADFFPDARRREAVKKVVEAGKAIKEKLLREAQSEMTEVDMDRVVDTVIAMMKSTASAGSSSASSELTPAV